MVARAAAELRGARGWWLASCEARPLLTGCDLLLTWELELELKLQLRVADELTAQLPPDRDAERIDSALEAATAGVYRRECFPMVSYLVQPEKHWEDVAAGLLEHELCRQQPIVKAQLAQQMTASNVLASYVEAQQLLARQDEGAHGCTRQLRPLQTSWLPVCMLEHVEVELGCPQHTAATSTLCHPARQLI